MANPTPYNIFYEQGQSSAQPFALQGPFRKNKFFHSKSSNTWPYRKREQNRLKFAIESENVEKIIGRGGSTITELEKLSGTSIEMDNSDCIPFVTIYGFSDSPEYAEKLIKQKLGYSNTTASNETPDCYNDWHKVQDERKMKEENISRLRGKLTIKKHFYHEHPEVANMSSIEVRELRANLNNLMVTLVNPRYQKTIPNPVIEFNHAFQKYPDILKQLEDAGFKSPSPIQCQAWPVLLQGHDMVGISQTGSGKTISFLLPGLIHVENQDTPMSRRIGPTCLILAPTWELAVQILDETKKYSYRGIRSVCIYGGVKKTRQVEELKEGTEILIGTPGRIIELVGDKALNLTCVSYLVLDEADRMLDLGFEPQIKKIVRYTHPDRQTVMTSATWPDDVQNLAKNYMNNPIQINVGSMDLHATRSVEQQFLFTNDEGERFKFAISAIEQIEENDKMLVFLKTKIMVDELADVIISKLSTKCGRIHGDRTPGQRQQALQDFKTGASKVLISTDVSCRGLDVKNITHVFNMYMPRHIEDYVHRVGRSGRHGRTGKAITIISFADRAKIPALINILKKSNQTVPPYFHILAESIRYEEEYRRIKKQSRSYFYT